MTQEETSAVFQELVAVAQMLEMARKEGLEVEVVWSLAQTMYSRGAGKREEDFAAACSEALMEWDI